MKEKQQQQLNIASKYGTPTYVYDMDQIKARYQYLKDAFPWPALNICYAMKANYNPDILKTLGSIGAYIDAVSPGDLYLALQCGFDISRIIYTANNMKESEVTAVMKTGVLVNIDSLSRLDKLAKSITSHMRYGFGISPIDPSHVL